MKDLGKADSFYKKNVLEVRDRISFLPSSENEKDTQIVSKVDLLPSFSKVRLKEHKHGIYYISDIHLDHKILKRFGDSGSLPQITKFIETTVDNLLRDDDGNEIEFFWTPATIMILGDTSHSFEINKLFYKTLSRRCSRYIFSSYSYTDIFVILGNHELWEFNSVEQAISAYSDFFNSLPNIHLLHNSLYADDYYKTPQEIQKLELERWKISSDRAMPKKVRNEALDENWKKLEELKSKEYGESEEKRHKFLTSKNILTEDMLKKMTEEEIRKACLTSREIVFGTTGFSPLNKRFNAKDGIYRNSVSSVVEEAKLAKTPAAIYKKLTTALPNNYLVVASHMPLEDWTSSPRINKWVYFHGHTHQNKRVSDEMGCVFADNQVGYYGKRIKFNAVLSEYRYDYFAYYKDGIYDISVTDYFYYYHGLSKRMVGVDTRGGGKIKMLKNKGLYLFLFQKNDGEIYLLEGGKRRILKNQDINYYYKNLARVNDVIEGAIEKSGIRDFLSQLSTFVKKLGGSGYIHGGIVDIDFFNHIMVDPINGRVIPYFAYAVNDRNEYRDIPALLQDNRPDLYEKYLNSGLDRELPMLRTNVDLSEPFKHSNDTSIYEVSNILLKIQDMHDYDVMRFWNDEIIKRLDDHPDNKLRGENPLLHG